MKLTLKSKFKTRKKKEIKVSELVITNTLEIDLPLAEVWAYFDDTKCFADTVPTLIEYTIIDEYNFKGKVGVTLGKIPVRSRLDFTILEKEPMSRIYGEGVSYLGESLVSLKKSKKETEEVNNKSAGYLSINLELEELSPSCTIARLTAIVKSQGRLRKIYESIIRTKVPALKQEFVDNIKDKFKVGVRQVDEAEALTGV